MTDLENDLDQNRRMCAACKTCRQQPTIHYEPGVMWLTCACSTKPRITLPDWDPKLIRTKWNDMQ